MARIRTIKPGFFRDEELYELEAASGLPCRVAYAGLWTVADREGRFRWEPRKIKLDCLPYDDVDFSRVLDALASRGFVVKYAIDGRDYGVIPTFTTHQIINNKEAKSELPHPPENGGNSGSSTREPRVDDAKGTPLNLSQVEQEQEQEQEQTNPQPPLPSESPEPAAASVGQDDIDQIRVAVWRQSGLTEDQITTKLVTLNGDGIRQARTWLESHPLQTILDAIAEAYDGAEKRGDAIRKPWAYLGTVVAGIAEKKAQEAAAPVVRDKWKDRRTLFESGAWPPPWGPPPGQSGCEAPQWVQEIYLNAKKGRAA